MQRTLLDWPEQLSRAMKQRDITDEALGDASGLPAQNVKAWREGWTYPTVYEAQQVLDALEMRFEEMMVL